MSGTASLEQVGVVRLAQFPVERVQRAADQAYRALRRGIVLGELLPGTRLREVEVAAALKVSRTPVREAISRLVGDGLVRELATGGVEVVDASSELFEILHIREALEGCAARLAAERISDELLAKLADLVEAAETTHHTAVEDRVRINEQFHLIIAEASGSRRLFDMIVGVREFFVNLEWRNRNDSESAAQSVSDHREILRALRARSGEDAERLVRLHLRTAYRTLLATQNVEP